MTAMQKMKSRGFVPKAVLYARFSSDNQREESIEAQLRAMHEYCQRNGAVVIREYCDRARSATTDDRPEFLSMIADARNHEFDFVVVHKLDRFSRNRYDSAYYKRELRKNGISLLSVLEHMDDSPESVILESVLEGMSEYYSKNLAREVMKGMRESALKCQALGGKPPFGYKVNPDTRRYEVNEEEAEAVRMIFRQVCEGYGYSEIITELNRLGYKTRNGNPFGKNSISEILRNEKYKGIYIFNRAASYSHNRTRNNHKSKPADEIIRIPGGMPALVDEKTFDRVAAIIKSRSRSAPNGRAKETYLLSGKVFCGACGSSYNGNRQFSGRNKNLLITYRCIKSNNHGDQRCRNKDVNRNYIEDFILKRIEEIVFAEERIPQLIAAYYASHEELAGDGVKILDRLYGNKNEIQRKIDNIISVITQSGSPSLLKTLDELEADKQALTIQIEQEEQNLIANRLNEQEIISAYRRAQELYRSGSLPQKRQLLNLYLKRVTVFPEYVQIHLHKVPTSVHTPSHSDSLDPEGQDIHILLKMAKRKPPSHFRKSGTGVKMVEARGVEPLSENLFTEISPGAADDLKFPLLSARRQAQRFGSFICHATLKALRSHVHC